MSVHRITLPQAQEQLAHRIEVGYDLVRRSSEVPSTAPEVHQLWAQFTKWNNYNITWIKTYLNEEVGQEYEQAVSVENPDGLSIPEYIAHYGEWEITKLESVQERLHLWLSESDAKSSSNPASRDAPIFIVHGSDTLRAESVAHTVASAIGRKTIILRDQPNSGRTLIEKFEQHAAEVSYAIVVLTADDKGSRADEPTPQPRGRQNVIFEMGYFYGLIGRGRVSVLIRPGVERPSDMDGIVYITFDDGRAWKTELFRELRQAGFNVHL